MRVTRRPAGGVRVTLEGQEFESYRVWFDLDDAAADRLAEALIDRSEPRPSRRRHSRC